MPIIGGEAQVALLGTGLVQSAAGVISYITGTAIQFVKADGSLDSNTYITGNQSITLSGEASGIGTTAITVTLDNAAVIAKVLTGYVSGAGVITAADSILTAIQKLNGNTAAATYTFSTGLTNAANTITSNIITGVAGGQTAIGGTGVGDKLSLKGTTGNGTLTAIAIDFLVGNNGATVAGKIYNDGSLNYGNAATIASPRIARFGQDTAFWDLGSLTTAGSSAAIYANQTTPSGTNYALQGTLTATILNSTSNTSIRVANNALAVFTTTTAAFNMSVSGGTTTPFTFGTAANSFVASVNTPSVFFNLGAAIAGHATGALAAQDDILVSQRTHTFVGASTLTEGSTLAIAGGLVGSTNATITNNSAVLIKAGTVANTTNSYGLTVNAQSGGSNNYTARFLGGNVGFGTSAPTALAHFAAGTTAANTAPIKLTSSGTGLTGLLTAPEAGAVEFTTYGSWITTTGAVRHKVWHGLVAQTAPTTSAIGVILDYYGTSATRVLTTPSSWGSMTGDDGVVYRVPLYLPA